MTQVDHRYHRYRRTDGYVAVIELFLSTCFVQVVHHGSRRELRLPAVKTTSYFNLFTVSAHGLMRGLEESEKNSESGQAVAVHSYRHLWTVMTQSLS